MSMRLLAAACLALTVGATPDDAVSLLQQKVEQEPEDLQARPEQFPANLKKPLTEAEIERYSHRHANKAAAAAEEAEAAPAFTTYSAPREKVHPGEKGFTRLTGEKLKGANKWRHEQAVKRAAQRKAAKHLSKLFSEDELREPQDVDVEPPVASNDPHDFFDMDTIVEATKQTAVAAKDVDDEEMAADADTTANAEELRRTEATRAVQDRFLFETETETETSESETADETISESSCDNTCEDTASDDSVITSPDTLASLCNTCCAGAGDADGTCDGICFHCGDEEESQEAALLQLDQVPHVSGLDGIDIGSISESDQKAFLNEAYIPQVDVHQDSELDVDNHDSELDHKKKQQAWVEPAHFKEILADLRTSEQERTDTDVEKDRVSRLLKDEGHDASEERAAKHDDNFEEEGAAAEPVRKGDYKPFVVFTPGVGSLPSGVLNAKEARIAAGAKKAFETTQGLAGWPQQQQQPQQPQAQYPQNNFQQQQQQPVYPANFWR